MPNRRLRLVVSTLLAATLVVGLSVVGATASGAVGSIAGASLPSPSPIPTDTPSPSPTPTDSPCMPDEDCVEASDEIDMFDDDGPMPSPSPTIDPMPSPTPAGVPALTASGTSRVGALAVPVPVPCGSAGLSATLRGPRGGINATLTGRFTVVSTVGAPITVTARRTTTVNPGAIVVVDNDGGVSPIPIWIVNHGPRLLIRPVNVNVTETGAAVPAPFFTYGAGRTCRGTRPLRVNVALP